MTVKNTDHCTNMRAHACAGSINFHIKVVASIDFALVRMEDGEGACSASFNPATGTSFSSRSARVEGRRERERERDEEGDGGKMRKLRGGRGVRVEMGERERDGALHQRFLAAV